MEHVLPETGLGKLLDHARRLEATDLHGQAEKPFTLRIRGELSRLPTDLFPPPAADAFDWLLAEALSPGAMDRIRPELEVDLSFYFCRERFRANFSKQMGRQSFSFRHVPRHQSRLRDLNLSPSLLECIQATHGLVLVAGSAGQGRSTTLRALLQEINEQRACRIITIEDPIERVFEDARAQFEQREVGIDTRSFADGIRNAMRQDADVIFIGELLDAGSTLAAMHAADCGRLVLSTLRAASASEAVSRILELFPVAERLRTAGLLARSLHALIIQRLDPCAGDERMPCVEMLKGGVAIEEAIRAACST